MQERHVVFWPVSSRMHCAEPCANAYSCWCESLLKMANHFVEPARTQSSRRWVRTSTQSCWLINQSLASPSLLWFREWLERFRDFLQCRLSTAWTCLDKQMLSVWTCFCQSFVGLGGLRWSAPSCSNHRCFDPFNGISSDVLWCAYIPLSSCFPSFCHSDACKTVVGGLGQSCWR